MKRNGKRGFTIVELVVVIAVVAILAAVLIPTFASVIRKANVSNDVALVRNLNEGLKVEEVGGKKNDTMTDALNVAKDYGYEVEKLTPRSSGEILWDSGNNRFALLDENGNAVYKDESKTLSSGANLWKIVNNATEAADNTEYSSYIKGNATIATLTVTNGVDVGENKVTELTYLNTTGTAKTVTIRTNGGNLTVKAPSDTVNHYNNLTSVDVQAVEPNSYHEYGSVGFVSVTSGRVEVKEGAKIVTIYAAAATAKIDAAANTVENAYAAAGVTNTGNLELDAIPEGKTIETVKEEAENKHNAVAKVGEVYQVSLEAAFTKALTMETAVVEIVSDIDLSASKWSPVDMKSSTVLKELTVNGNNHVITGLNVHMAATNDPQGEPQAGASNYYGVGFFGRISVDIKAVASASYHEYGKVLGTVKVESGHVKVEKGAEVASVIAVATTADVKATITAENGSKVGTVVVNDEAAKVEVKADAEVTEVAPGKEGIKVNVTGKEASTTVIDTEKASGFEGGLGTEASPYLIANKEQFKNITTGASKKEKYYNLISDITFTESDELAGARWGYVVYRPEKVSYINLNGNGKYIKCESVAAVFDIIRNSTVMNLNVEIKNKFATQTIGVTFDGVNFYGNVSWDGGNNGLICAYVTDGLTAINCNNYATINSTGDENAYNAIFTGYAFTENATLSFKNCNNYGSLISGKASMFIGNVRYKSKLVVENCLNKGEIRATYMGYTPNCYVSVSERNIISLTLNGETKTLDTVLSSGFYHGPSDTIVLTKNTDNTLTFTKSNNKTVSYYVVSVGVYTKFDQDDGLGFNSGATDRVYVTQRIEATEAETYVTELKVLSFVDNAWAKNNAGAVAGKLAGNDTYTLNGNTYYFISSTKHSVDGTAKVPQMVTVSAYAADGTLISSASLAK